eukprot:g57030.t1
MENGTPQLGPIREAGVDLTPLLEEDRDKDKLYDQRSADEWEYDEEPWLTVMYRHWTWLLHSPWFLVRGTKQLFSDPRAYFQLEERRTNVTQELRAGLITYLTMVYIVFVNSSVLAAPVFLSDPEGAPAFQASVSAMTALAAGSSTLVMGVVANWPMALAPGLGLSPFVAYTVILSNGATMQEAMGLVLWDGFMLVASTVFGTRQSVMNTMPGNLGKAISVGIGCFLAFIGLVDSEIVVVPFGTASTLVETGKQPRLPPVQAGTLLNSSAYVTLVGLAVTTVLSIKQVPGALGLGIICAMLISFAVPGMVDWSRLEGFSWPSFQCAMQADLDVLWARRPGLFIPTCLSMVILDFFDTLGTMTAVGEKAGLALDPRPSVPMLRSSSSSNSSSSQNIAGLSNNNSVVGGHADLGSTAGPSTFATDVIIPDSPKKQRFPNVTSVLLIDGLASILGGLLGVSSQTSYIESTAGVASGARTGLASVCTGVLFLLTVFLAPLTVLIHQSATAPALIFVGYLMFDQAKEIEWRKVDQGIPAFLTIVMMPLSFSIATGIGYGFIFFALGSLCTGKWRQTSKIISAETKKAVLRVSLKFHSCSVSKRSSAMHLCKRRTWKSAFEISVVVVFQN